MLKKLTASISAKVLAVLAIFIVTQLVVYVVINERTFKIEQANENLLNIANTSTIVYEINKDILEIQRDISVYGVSGSDVIFKKIKSNYTSIKKRLDDAKRQTQDDEMKHALTSMQSLVVNYGKGIKVLKRRYEEKSQVIDITLPNIYESAISSLTALSKKSDSEKNSLWLAQLKNQWHSLYRDSSLFLTKRDYSKRQQVKITIEQINQLLAAEQSASTNKSNVIKDLKRLVSEFDAAFTKAIQANRNYLTLINIVIAGDSVEFTSLAKQLRDDALILLEETSTISKNGIAAAQVVIKASLFLSIVFFVLFALFFHFHIVEAINRLTLSFKALLNGDYNVVLSDTHRVDEIGVLSRAANKFKILNEHLIEAKKAAEETTRIKSEFLANMSHEIRTPMNGILGMVQLVNNTTLNTEQKRMIEVISSSGNSLLVILNDILDLSKLDAEKMLIEERDFKLSALIYELEQIFKSQANHKNIEFNFPTAELESCDLVKGDETRLKQVLMNLLGNAFKFTESGQVTLAIDFKEQAENKVTLLFSIIDSGIGISQESIKTLFDAFTQADTSTTRRFGGTGLGLTISNKILNLMGTTLQVKSELGKGSTFYFELTLNTSSQSTSLIEEKPQPLNGNFKGKRILIAEDNPVNQIVLKSFLEKMGIEHITTADNGEIAVNMCTKQHFDLIMMDIQMPVMDGLLASKLIRELPGYSDTPIIATTANITHNDEPDYINAGITDIVNKPIEFNALQAALAKHT